MCTASAVFACSRVRTAPWLSRGAKTPLTGRRLLFRLGVQHIRFEYAQYRLLYYPLVQGRALALAALASRSGVGPAMQAGDSGTAQGAAGRSLLLRGSRASLPPVGHVAPWGEGGARAGRAWGPPHTAVSLPSRPRSVFSRSRWTTHRPAVQGRESRGAARRCHRRLHHSRRRRRRRLHHSRRRRRRRRRPREAAPPSGGGRRPRPPPAAWRRSCSGGAGCSGRPCPS